MYSRSIGAAVALAVFVILTPVMSRAETSLLIDLGTFGGTLSYAYAVNESGEVVGIAYNGNEFKAFLYRGGAMIDLGTFGGVTSEARAINASGQVVGSATTPLNAETHAFLYSGGVMTDLGTLGGTESTAIAINESGEVAGEAETPDGYNHAFLYSGGVMIDLGTLGGANSYATDINSVGQVVGDARPVTNLGYHAFLYSDGVMTDLGTLGGTQSHASAINDVGQVVGDSRTASGELHAFLYSDGVMTDLGALPVGDDFSGANAINNAGQVVGQSGSFPPRAFLYSDGVMTDLGNLGQPGAVAHDINDVGEVVGGAATATGEGHAFRYSGGLMMDLGTLGGSFSTAVDINDAGQVVGWASPADDDAFDRAFLMACGAAPIATCTDGPRASLQIKDDVDDAKDQLKWKWGRGGTISQQDLGDPRDDTPYTLCIYDSTAGVDELVGTVRIDPNDSWLDKNPKGWSYKDTTAKEDGVQKAQLTTGAAGKSKAQLRAKGVDIPMPVPQSDTAYFHQDARVTVQLFNDSTPTCWTSEFTTATINDGVQFKAKTP